MLARGLVALGMVAVPLSGCFGEVTTYNVGVDHRAVADLAGVGPGVSMDGGVVNLKAEKVVVTKPDPGPLGGGGVQTELQTPQARATATVRVKGTFGAAEASDLRVGWRMVSPDGAESDLGITALNGSVEVPLDSPGLWGIRYAIRTEDPSLEGLLDPGQKLEGELDLPVNVVWEIESRIHPLRPDSALPTPPNWNAMGDDFKLPPLGPDGLLRAESWYRGTYSPPSGVDIDLELRHGAKSVKCVGSTEGGSSSPVDPFTNPKHAHEQAEAALRDGAGWLVRAGAVSEGCGPGWFYANLDEVPYRLVIQARFDCDPGALAAEEFGRTAGFRATCRDADARTPPPSATPGVPVRR